MKIKSQYFQLEQSTLDNTYMQIALIEAKKAFKKDEVPIGAILVGDNKIIAKAHNLVQTKSNTCYHAEFLVIQKTLKKLKLKHLHNTTSKYTLYTTLEPCPMCAGAIILSKIDRVVIGAMDSKSGAAGSVVNLLQNPSFNHQCEIITNVFGIESSEMLKIFNLKRKKL